MSRRWLLAAALVALAGCDKGNRPMRGNDAGVGGPVVPPPSAAATVSVDARGRRDFSAGQLRECVLYRMPVTNETRLNVSFVAGPEDGPRLSLTLTGFSPANTYHRLVGVEGGSLRANLFAEPYTSVLLNPRPTAASPAPPPVRTTCTFRYQARPGWLSGTFACTNLMTPGMAPFTASGRFQCPLIDRR